MMGLILRKIVQWTVVNKLACFAGALLLTACSENEPAASDTTTTANQGPLNSSYTVAETRFNLRNDRAEVAATPNTANMASLSLLGTDHHHSGWVQLGHEVRTFIPCDKNTVYWLQGEPSALSVLKKLYQANTQATLTGKPLLMTLAGHPTPKPSDGFGADYPSGFVIEQVLGVKPEGHCREAFISISKPLAGSVVTSPLSVKGSARGNWFFEGDFPIAIEDMAGNILSRSYVTAEGDWMTPNFVPFNGSINFTVAGNISAGYLVFTKDNPSDRKELDDATRIPVLFRY